MGLQGNLEDLPLLDILQIVSFSKKTGYLAIATEGGEGAIVFYDGLVVAAFTAGSPPPDPRLGGSPAATRATARCGPGSPSLSSSSSRLREGAFASS